MRLRNTTSPNSIPNQRNEGANNEIIAYMRYYVEVWSRTALF